MLCGLPAAGKTFLARLLESHAEVRLCWHSANFRSLSCLLMMLFAAVPQAEGAAVAVVSFDDVEVKLREEGGGGAGASHR